MVGARRSLQGARRRHRHRHNASGAFSRGATAEYSIDQLDYYLDEFTFRFNRRPARSRGLLFYRLLHQAVTTDPHPYRELITAASLDHHDD